MSLSWFVIYQFCDRMASRGEDPNVCMARSRQKLTAPAQFTFTYVIIKMPFFLIPSILTIIVITKSRLILVLLVSGLTTSLPFLRFHMWRHFVLLLKLNKGFINQPFRLFKMNDTCYQSQLLGALPHLGARQCQSPSEEKVSSTYFSCVNLQMWAMNRKL